MKTHKYHSSDESTALGAQQICLTEYLRSLS